jgi:hypothetical protein
VSDEQSEFPFDDERRPKKSRKKKPSQPKKPYKKSLKHGMNLSEGMRLKDEGIGKVLDNEHPKVVEWKEAFTQARDMLIDSNQWFTGEHIRGVCGDPPEEAHHNIFGAMCNSIWRISNIIGRAKSERPPSHGAQINVYKGRKDNDDA